MPSLRDAEPRPPESPWSADSAVLAPGLLEANSCHTGDPHPRFKSIFKVVHTPGNPGDNSAPALPQAQVQDPVVWGGNDDWGDSGGTGSSRGWGWGAGTPWGMGDTSGWGDPSVQWGTTTAGWPLEASLTSQTS
ncbi:hypothetical protein B0H15DRAFT_804877 [Mycena belliarum]|uniref:Uncharacterized protein n=1 Tax=Mycena belliarum TaxID=1033014 RepID=A0AAD6TSL3_9AGAR|nr:hypothetical protein B0H15DRAFT_804877 [Mycena belliae]